MGDSEARRDFLRRIATGAIYAAPVVRSLTAPDAVSGRAATQIMMMMRMMRGMVSEFPTPDQATAQRTTVAPWSSGPPGGGE